MALRGATALIPQVLEVASKMDSSNKFYVFCEDEMLQSESFDLLLIPMLPFLPALGKSICCQEDGLETVLGWAQKSTLHDGQVHSNRLVLFARMRLVSPLEPKPQRF